MPIFMLQPAKQPTATTKPPTIVKKKKEKKTKPAGLICFNNI